MKSDNAKTFTASAREVKKILCTIEVTQCLTDRKVIWGFVTKKAPWWEDFENFRLGV